MAGERSHDAATGVVVPGARQGGARDLERQPELPLFERAGGRPRRDRRLVAEREGLAATLASESTPLDQNDRWWSLEMPDQGLRRPPPCRGVRLREARGLRRVRRHLRENVSAERSTPLEVSRRRVITEAAGIAVSAMGFGFVYGLAARDAGFSPIEAMAMSTSSCSPVLRSSPRWATS